MSERYDDRDKTQMALRILEAMSGVDEELLLRSESRPRTYRTYGRAAAACLALAVVGVLSWNGLKMTMTTKDSNAAFPTEGAGDDCIPLTEEAFDTDTGMPAGGPDILENTEAVREEGGLGTPLFQDDGNKSMNTNVSEAESMDWEKESSKEDRMISDNAESCEYSRSPGEELSEEEARNAEVFGDYIPESMPAGYTFENAWSSDDGLAVTWTRGMDSIMISLSLAVPESVVTVDVGETAAYDTGLYEIPYGESVPEQYREIFQDPVFAAADMSLEVVNSRMKSIEDAGDTDTPRGCFSVLYPDGVVLRFNGRGTAEEIWSMLNSLKRK